MRTVSKASAERQREKVTSRKCSLVENWPYSPTKVRKLALKLKFKRYNIT